MNTYNLAARTKLGMQMLSWPQFFLILICLWRRLGLAWFKTGFSIRWPGTSLSLYSTSTLIGVNLSLRLLCNKRIYIREDYIKIVALNIPWDMLYALCRVPNLCLMTRLFSPRFLLLYAKRRSSMIASKPCPALSHKQNLYQYLINWTF